MLRTVWFFNSNDTWFYFHLMQLRGRRVVECSNHHKRHVREEEHPQSLHVGRTSDNWMIAAREISGCLLSYCEALRTCRSNFPVGTLHETAWNVNKAYHTDVCPMFCIIRADNSKRVSFLNDSFFSQTTIFLKIKVVWVVAWQGRKLYVVPLK